jgi:hypothetical protein
MSGDIEKSADNAYAGKYLQKCLVCGYKCVFTFKNDKEFQMVSASTLGCGHQGLFTLTKMEND